DDHAILEPARGSEIDCAGDTRARRRGTRTWRMADADRIGGLIAVIGEGEHIAVAGTASAEPVGKPQPLLARAQKDFRRAERARAEHDDARGHRTLRLSEPVAAIARRREE